MKVGIDALTYDLPKLFVSIEQLALARNIEPEKLTKGLGLLKMSVPDYHQDAVTMAANALRKLIQQEQLNLATIGKIYIGTESSVDAAKPISSYILPLIEQEYGNDSLLNCDIIDMTFACIGGVDALQIVSDWVRLNPTKKAIVICTDIAKYDLKSGGEYTQGAGAIALLVSENPRLLSFTGKTGVSTKGVFDFFKPRRTISKKEITQDDTNKDWFGVLESEIELFKEQPVFDGQYSNRCYQERVKEAYLHFKKENNVENQSIIDEWCAILMHLPYAYQGRRMFSEVYCLDQKIEIPVDLESATLFLKNITKSTDYKSFIESKIKPSEIASSQIGNIYTGSIFLGLISMLVYHYEKDNDLSQTKVGFIAYGSGSKAKVFEAEIQPTWKKIAEKLPLFKTLNEAQEMDMQTYEKWHKKVLKTSILPPCKEYVFKGVEQENPLKIGARYYEWVE